MRPMPLDLFGQVIITTQDLDTWLIAVPKMRPGTRRAAWYLKAYDVVQKITQAKLSGHFAELEAQALELEPYKLQALRWI